MNQDRDRIAAWVAREILPTEKKTRIWLARRWGRIIDVDDVIQEAYCRIASLSSIDHIDNPGAYFRKTAHAAATDDVRRAGKNAAASMKENDWLNVLDDEPLADRVLEARQDLDHMADLLSELSLVCRQVIVLRRIEGLSQKETAVRLGVSEGVVENHIMRGLKKVLKAMADQGEQPGKVERKVHSIGKPRPR